MKRFVYHINSFLKVNMDVSKLLAVTGVLLVALFGVILLGACGSANLAEESGEIEYTDVEYSKDGSTVTLYLDGVGVPVSRSQRAVTKDLAQTAFNFVEVIFVGGSNIARKSWQLGERAGIDGVYTNGSTGFPYGTVANACMFVGRENDRVLLGVGRLVETRPAGANATTIYETTKSVTFSISALQTGLLVGTETTAGTGAAADSFSLKSVGFRRTLEDGISYPVYLIGSGDTEATYTFYLTSGTGVTTPMTTYGPGIKHYVTAAVGPRIEKRTPRFAGDESRYKEPRNLIDTKTQITTTYAPGNNATFVNAVPIKFTNPVGNTGIFSFNIQIPVYMVNADPATNTSGGGTSRIIWFIRTGIGSEFYSLDDGISRGGCVLISAGIGNTTSEWNNISWTWFRDL